MDYLGVIAALFVGSVLTGIAVVVMHFFIADALFADCGNKRLLL
ncbi:hypothetical protein NHJ13051_007776 [Beauveria bassiana]